MSEPAVTDRLFHETAVENSLRAAERLSDDAWARLKEHPEKFRVLTGDRPTGALHLGHYFGSLQRRVEVQSRGVQTWLLLADYQALTDRAGSVDLQESMADIVLDYIAVGIDVQSDRGLAFRHSQVPELNQLMLPFLSLVSVSEIERNPTVKSEIETLGSGHVTGLMFNYPVHQAADILFCKATVVPVGRDQLPHLELTRTIARRFNERYQPVFPLPDGLLGEAPSLPGLDGRKMSKSLNNAIALSDGPDVVAAKIRSARTDGEREISYEPERRPEVANLLTLAALCSGTDPISLAGQVGGGGGAGLKQLAIDAVNTFLTPLRARRAQYDEADAARLLATGAARANRIADQTLSEVTVAMGMNHRPPVSSPQGMPVG